MGWKDRCELNVLVGKTVLWISSSDAQVQFHCVEGTFVFHHEQDCCESVTLEHIEGVLPNFRPQKVISAEARDGDGPVNEYADHATWTFYDIQTEEMSISMRWCGESNGYYSESVDYEFIPTKEVS